MEMFLRNGMLFWAILVANSCGFLSVNGNDTTAGEFEAAFQGKCGPSSPCVQLCVELHDGTFECQCRVGYRLLLDGYSCVELTNSTYSDDDDDSDEFDNDKTRRRITERQEERNRYKIAAKAAAETAAAEAAADSAKMKDSVGGLLSRPLPRQIASSARSKNSKSVNAAAAAAEAKERNSFLQKFSPVDPDNSLDKEHSGAEIVNKLFELEESSSRTKTKKLGGAKTEEKMKKVEEDEDDEYDYSAEDEKDEDDEDDENEEDDDSTNEAEEDLRSLERSVTVSITGKDAVGGGEEDDEGSDEDFVLPPRALPLIKEAAEPPSSPFPSSLPDPPTSLGSILKSSAVKSGALPPFPSSIPEEPSSSFSSQMFGGGGGGDAPPPPSPPDSSPPPSINCPLNCNRGVCTEELVDENSSPEDKLNVGYRCLCPMGTKGTFCETQEVFEEGGGYNSGLFRGESWVAFPVLHDAYMSDQISLEFRPQSANGILLLTGERDDLSGDYLALFLQNGYLEFRFDCGSGSGMVRSAVPVNLEQWNKASIVRRRWDGWMQLNDGPFTQGRSKGLFSRITFRQPVYIGGQGNITFNSVSSIQSNFDEEPELSSSSTPPTVNLTGTYYSPPPFALSTGYSSSVPGGVSPTAAEEKSSFSSGSPTLTPASSSSSSSSSSFSRSVFPSSSSPSSGSVVSSTQDGVTGEESGLRNDGSTTTVTVLKGLGGFKGCIRNLVINDRTYRFGLEPAGDSLQGFDIENCNDQGVCDLVKCQHGGQCLVQKDENPTCLCPLGFSGPLCETPLDLQIPSFNGSSYLKYGGLGLTRVLSWLELEIVIKPDAMDGLIMYNGYKTDGMGDFISIVIDQGYIEFAMDLGTGAAIIRSDAPVVLGEWHHIHVSRTSRLISLRIDNQPPLMALTPGAFTQLSLPHNLFLGGIPDPLWLSPKVKVHGGFSGCIQKLVINEKPLRIMGSAMSGVNLENCAHPCLRNPCDHGGDCVPLLDTFKCHCPLGYRDTYCSTRMDKQDVITSPRFIGDSYLRFTNPRIIKRLSGWRLNLSFRLKTDLSRGLLLWAGRKWMTSASDFLSMGLRNGFITASFSLGSGQITIAYNFTSVNDGQWHHVHLLRNEQEATLSVDDGPPITGVAPGKLRQLNINDGLYIGGLEDARHQSMNRYSEGFVGCLTDLVLGSERVSLLQEASEGRNVDYCD